MNILITGSKGVLGTRLCDLINKSELYKLYKFKGDVTNYDQVKSNFSDKIIYDVIIHLAAIVPVNLVKENPGKAFSVNVGGTINLLRAANNLRKKPFFLYASTSHVYSPKNKPLKENDELKPSSLYGKTKLHAENILISFCEYVGMGYCIARIFSLYDENQKPPFLFANIKNRLQSEDLTKPFKISRGQSKRDFLSARQISKIMLKLIQEKKTGKYNIGSGIGKTVVDFVKEISPVSLNVQTDEEFDHLVADVTKIKQFLK